MISPILKISCNLPPISEKDVLRYAGEKNTEGETLFLFRECLQECQEIFASEAVYRILNIDRENIFSVGGIKILSKDLEKNLQGCDQAIVFAATAGLGIDRLIAKYLKISPARALIFHSIGTERVEALCDAFCETMQNKETRSLRPRFSPGYGDLPLDIQKDILHLLNADKTLGIGLNESYLLSPSKSVTAFVGIQSKKE